MLCHAEERPTATEVLCPQGGDWVFLARDYQRQREWKDLLGTRFRHIETRDYLAASWKRLRKPYIELIASIGEKLQSVAWWASRVSERNTLISHLFLYSCYLDIARELIESKRNGLLVVSESWALLETISDMATSTGCWSIAWVRRRSRARDAASVAFKIGLRLTQLVHAYLMSRLFGRDDGPPGKPVVLLHTYVDDGCFGADGRFHDRYFPGLAEWLESRGYCTATLPVLFNVTSPHRKIWQWFRNASGTYINSRRHCNLVDYVFAGLESWRSLNLPLRQINLLGMDLTRLFDEERWRTAFDSMLILLYVRLPLRLCEHGYRVDGVVVEHENMIPEKLLTIGFRRYSSRSFILGYQHGGLYPALLCSFVPAAEARYAPLPDRIVSCGSLYRDALLAEGMPENLLVDGPALRHAYLWRSSGANDEGNSIKWCSDLRNWDILVILPMMASDAAELLLKTLDALENMSQLRIALKCHPMLGSNVVMASSGISNLPVNFQFISGDLGDMVRRSRLAICMSSTSILEVLVSGTPMMVVGRESGLNFNPLGFIADHDQLYYTPNEIRIEVVRLLGLSLSQLEALATNARALASRCFNRVTEQSLESFLIASAASSNLSQGDTR